MEVVLREERLLGVDQADVAIRTHQDAQELQEFVDTLLPSQELGEQQVEHPLREVRQDRLRAGQVQARQCGLQPVEPGDDRVDLAAGAEDPAQDLVPLLGFDRFLKAAQQFDQEADGSRGGAESRRDGGGLRVRQRQPHVGEELSRPGPGEPGERGQERGELADQPVKAASLTGHDRARGRARTRGTSWIVSTGSSSPIIFGP